MGVTVVGLGAWAELARKDQEGMDIDVHEFAALDDGVALRCTKSVVSAPARRSWLPITPRAVC